MSGRTNLWDVMLRGVRHAGINDFPHSDEDDVAAAMPVMREAGVPFLVHAEIVSDLPPAPKVALPHLPPPFLATPCCRVGHRRTSQQKTQKH